MIKNNSQYKRTLAKIEEMEAAKAAFIQENNDIASAKYQFGLNSFDAIISDLNIEKDDYEYLLSGGFKIIDPKSIEAIPKAIIQTRIALGLTQKEFAEKVGLKEQQIQRYESEDYQGVSFDRILDFTEVLGLKFHIEKILMKTRATDLFSYGANITEEKVAIEAQKVKARHSLLIAC